MSIASARPPGSRHAGHAFVVAGALACAACTAAPSRPAVPAPAGAIVAAPLSHDRVAVLAGTADAKAVSIIDVANGNILGEFGVTREADGIAAETDEGPLLVSVGGTSRNRAFGAVERWGMRGRKLAVAAMPSLALGITRNVGGTVYVLLSGRNDARAAVPLEIPSLRMQKPVALDAGARQLQLCEFSAAPYLLYTNRRGFVTMRALESRTTSTSSVAADAPDCGEDGRVYAIRKGFASRAIVAMNPPSLQETGALPVSDDAVALYDVGNGTLLELNATSRAATLTELPEPSIVTTASR